MLVIARTTTREQRLGWEPEAAIEAALASGERAVVATAMFEQLVAAGIPVDAIDMCIVYWSRALDGISPGLVADDRLARLDVDLAYYRERMPVFARWLAALRSRSATAHDLDWVIQFLLHVRQTWILSTTLTQ